MLYVGAVQGTDRWMRPKHVIRMSDAQAASRTDAARRAYMEASQAPRFKPKGRPWYAENSREQIRDEIIRKGLIVNNAVVERRDIPTTSSVPRYALRTAFASLFAPQLSGDSLTTAITSWQSNNLSPEALARSTAIRAGAAPSAEGILVRFPNGETRRMPAGPSSEILRGVIEQFAPRFLRSPAVLWMTDGRKKWEHRDDQLTRRLGLRIDPSRNLPDAILFDLGAHESASDTLVVFVEAVATDGPIDDQRQAALRQLATDAGFQTRRIAFVTAFQDRGGAAFRKTIGTLAWQSFAWFVSEPDKIIVLHDGTRSVRRLIDLVSES